MLVVPGEPSLMQAYDLLTTPILVVADFEVPTLAFNAAARAFFGVDADAERFYVKRHYKMLLDADLDEGFAQLASGGTARVSSLVCDKHRQWSRAVITAKSLTEPPQPPRGAVITVDIQDEAVENHGPYSPSSMLEHLVWDAPNVGISITPDTMAPALVWNSGMYTLLGLPNKEASPSNDLFLRHVHPADHPIIEGLGTALVVDGLDSWEGNFRLVTDAGKEVRVSAWVVNQANADGTRSLASLMISTEEELLATRDAAAARRELEKFTYTISHDLRAPVRHIESFLLLLLDSIAERLDQEEEQYASFARQSVHKLAGMIQGMVDYSRLPITLTNIQEVHLPDLLGDLITTQFPGAADRLAVRALPTVSGDPALLEKLFAHLISNAIKFSRDKPASPIIIDASTVSSPLTRIEVSDEGVGFDVQHTERLFEIFQRLHGVQEFPGLGIGLALCKRIVELHGGEISVKGELGKGTRVSLTLPLSIGYSETKTRASTS